MQRSYQLEAIKFLSSPLYMLKKEANLIFNSLHLVQDVEKYDQKKLFNSATEFSITTDYNSSQSSESESIAFYYLEGCVTWNTSWWFSTSRLIQDLIDADNNDNIIAHFLLINSGGGETYGMDQAYETIANLKKPIVAITEQVMASAAYNIGCGCTKVYAANQFSQIGSIGVMCQYYDWSEYHKQMGIKEVAIYASESTHKNKRYKDIEKGDTEEFIAQVLDPLLVVFKEQVLRARPGISVHEDKHILNGEMFFATEAMEYDMIDGIKSIDEALIECYELGQQAKLNIGIQKEIINQYNSNEL